MPPVIGNNLYKIQFKQPVDTRSNLFNQQYTFDLEEAVGDTTECLIDMRDLKDLCGQNELKIVNYFPNLETLLKDEHIPAKAKQIFTRMMKKTAKFVFLMN